MNEKIGSIKEEQDAKKPKRIAQKVDLIKEITSKRQSFYNTESPKKGLASKFLLAKSHFLSRSDQTETQLQCK